MSETRLILRADAERLPLADKSVDCVISSPPYCDARTYEDGTLPDGVTVSRGCAEWVEWMLRVTDEAIRVSRGAVIWVCSGVTRKRDYWPAPEGLLWEWFRRGGSSYRPVIWNRTGIPGSGGTDWFRADTEYCLCFKPHGELVWSDNTACGHPPKYAPGGEFSHRSKSGKRVNQWGGTSHSSNRTRNGSREKHIAPSHKYGEKAKEVCAIANPGNLIKTGNGGGQLGDKMCHENEAPFPEDLVKFFLLSLCPPGGVVLDPFSGSGTTAKVATQNGRGFVACDLRESQILLTQRRVASVQRMMF